MNAIATTWNGLARRAAVFVIGSISLLASTSTAPGGSIFDDDYIPPRRVEPAPQPMTPVPNPATPTPAPPSVTPAPAVRPPDVAAPKPAGVVENVRHAVPDKASRVRFRKLFEEVFVAELKDRTPASRRKLAERLMSEAGKVEAGSPDRFVLLVGAVQAAEEGQNLRVCFSAAQLLAKEYDVDELATEADAATKVFSGAPSPALATVGNIERLLDLSDQLMAEDDFATAGQVESVLQRIVGAIADADLKKEVNDQIRDVTAVHEAWDKLAPTLGQLKKSPDDPVANLAVGSYLCFLRGQWENGLPLLVKSGDAQLKDIATADLAHPAGGDALVRLADRWVDAASKLAATDRPRMMQHATSLYRSAVSELTGLQKMAVETRIAKIPPSRLRRIDLLELFDPEKSVVNGVWRVQDGVLVVEPGEQARVRFAYAPGDEYDFRISFTAVHGNECVTQICTGAGHQFLFLAGGWGNTIAAFDLVDGAGGNVNVTSKRKKRWLINGQHYTSVIKVRRAGVEAYLDGQLVTSLKTDYSNMSLHPVWQLARGEMVGIGASQDAVRFDTAEIVEITGEGKFLSP